MFLSRKLPAFVLLASYLFAVTLAERFHNHGGQCGHGECAHSAGGHTHSREDAKGHQHSHRRHAAHHHDHRGNAAQRARFDGAECHATAHCAVCDFLSQLPLPAAPAALVTCGRLPRQIVVLRDSQCSGWVRNTHLPRGPPSVS